MTTNQILPRAEQIQAHLVEAGIKGYANSKTLARAQKGLAAALQRDKLAANYEEVVIGSGPHAGRVAPVLVFGPRETVDQTAIAYAFQGIVLFQCRA